MSDLPPEDPSPGAARWSATDAGHGRDTKASVTRLVTSVDVDDDDEPDAARMSVSVRHEAELDDGRRVVLLDDRGWSSSGAPNIWDRTSVEELARTAREVVSPAYDHSEDEGSSRDFVEGFHFGMLVGILWQQGVVTSAPQLQEIPHDVDLSDRVLARLGQSSQTRSARW